MAGRSALKATRRSAEARDKATRRDRLREDPELVGLKDATRIIENGWKTVTPGKLAALTIRRDENRFSHPLSNGNIRSGFRMALRDDKDFQVLEQLARAQFGILRTRLRHLSDTPEAISFRYDPSYRVVVRGLGSVGEVRVGVFAIEHMKGGEAEVNEALNVIKKQLEEEKAKILRQGELPLLLS